MAGSFIKWQPIEMHQSWQVPLPFPFIRVIIELDNVKRSGLLVLCSCELWQHDIWAASPYKRQSTSQMMRMHVRLGSLTTGSTFFFYQESWYPLPKIFCPSPISSYTISGRDMIFVGQANTACDFATCPITVHFMRQLGAAHCTWASTLVTL